MPTKADEILRVGQALIQTQGYDGFSFRDVADAVGIKSASVHYHYPSKADLALAVAESYRHQFLGLLAEIDDRGLPPFERLVAYVELFRHTLGADQMCLCGMLASEASTLPNKVRNEVDGFFEDQHHWVAHVIGAGIDEGAVAEAIDPPRFAHAFVSGLEGALMIARSIDDAGHFDGVADQLLQLIRS